MEIVLSLNKIFQAYADKLSIPFIETSAIDATNVETAFITITKDLIASRYAISTVFDFLIMLLNRGLAPATSTADKSANIGNLSQPTGTSKKSSCC